MEMAEKRISLSVVKDALRVLNQKYLDIENRNQQSIQSSGMSLGESLFRQFTEPYFNFAVWKECPYELLNNLTFKKLRKDEEKYQFFLTFVVERKD